MFHKKSISVLSLLLILVTNTLFLNSKRRNISLLKVFFTETFYFSLQTLFWFSIKERQIERLKTQFKIFTFVNLYISVRVGSFFYKSEW
jgi:hypothetical protein